MMIFSFETLFRPFLTSTDNRSDSRGNHPRPKFKQFRPNEYTNIGGCNGGSCGNK